MIRKRELISIFTFSLALALLSVSSCGSMNMQKSGPGNNTEITSYLKFTDEWPEWVIKSIPQYSYGKLFKAEIDKGFHTLYFKEVFKGNTPYESYLNELLQQGWKLETDNLGGFPVEHLKTAFLSMGDFQLTYTVSYESNEAHLAYNKSDLHLKNQK